MYIFLVGNHDFHYISDYFMILQEVHVMVINEIQLKEFSMM